MRLFDGGSEFKLSVLKILMQTTKVDPTVAFSSLFLLLRNLFLRRQSHCSHDFRCCLHWSWWRWRYCSLDSDLLGSVELEPGSPHGYRYTSHLKDTIAVAVDIRIDDSVTPNW